LNRDWKDLGFDIREGHLHVFKEELDGVLFDKEI
jgi:hypothetical protein